MSIPTRSCSSVRGSEGYFDWREMQALLQETRRLKEENEVLRIQLSSANPPRSRQPRSQQTNSRQNEKATYPGNTESSSDEHDMQLNERPLLAYYASQKETSDSTRVL
ncbi:hypothetical protein PVL29_000744 [Vitis rotundifolia]|uniref:Uncharacterized protein n=1 Tax=Vitis rotundifolia TaxID=103349 RepID=A0AA39E711_VITRO|nr:hypothetical protein PVL29_000744 [Vitis rotundifolia]